MRAVAIFACLLACTGCIPVATHSICTGDEPGFDSRFVGAWGATGGYWELLGGSNISGTHDDGTGNYVEQYNAFDVYYTEAGKSSSLRGRLTTIGGVTLMDLTPQRSYNTGPGTDPGGQFIELMLSWPLHTWVKIEIVDGKLEMTPASLDWLNEYLAANPQALPHIYGEDDHWPIITASTDKLRAFIAAHLHDEGFFGEPSDLTHLGPPSSHPRMGGIQSGNASYDSAYKNPTKSTKAKRKKKASKRRH